MCETPTQLYLILELADGGDLFDKITQNGRLSEEVRSEPKSGVVCCLLRCFAQHERDCLAGVGSIMALSLVRR